MNTRDNYYIWIIIPVHNRKTMTQGCLESLMNQTYPYFRIVVVDDGSQDGTAEMIRHLYPDVFLLQGGGNLWWTGAINKGILFALEHSGQSDCLLLLNDDLVVPNNYLEKFIKIFNENHRTCIGSVVTDYEERDVIQSGGSSINWLTAKLKKNNMGKKLSDFPSGYALEVSTLTGRGVLFPSEVFRKYGLYNERHYKHSGDMEFPRRLKKAGYKLIVAYDVAVFSHPPEKDHINSKERYRLKDIAEYFFSLRSHQNLKCRFWFAYDCGTSFIYSSIYFICDLARITNNFIAKLR